MGLDMETPSPMQQAGFTRSTPSGALGSSRAKVGTMRVGERRGHLLSRFASLALKAADPS